MPEMTLNSETIGYYLLITGIAILLFILGSWWATHGTQEKRESKINPIVGLPEDKIRLYILTDLVQPKEKAMTHLKKGNFTEDEIIQLKAVQVLRDIGLFTAEIKELIYAENSEKELNLLEEKEERIREIYRNTTEIQDAVKILRHYTDLVQ